MKNIIYISIILAIFSFTAYGQKNKVPPKVKSSFEQKFPDAQKIKWDMENKSEWEAEFTFNRKEYSANFSADGKWMETEYEIEEEDIPKIVKKTLDSKFSGYKIEEAEISETTKGKLYEFELEKGKTVLEVAISPQGKIVKKEMKKEENEDND